MNFQLLANMFILSIFNIFALQSLNGQAPILEGDCWVCKDGKHISESPYKELTFKNELPFIVVSVSSLTASILTINLNKEIPTVEEINRLDRMDVNSFDRIATSYSSSSTASISDYFRTGITFIPIFFLANHHTRDDVGALLVLTSEVMGTTAGLTFMAKNIFPRYRPFLYNPDFTIDEKQNKSSTKSFFSGHASHTAAFAFLIAKVYHDYHPNSKQFMKILVWSFSAALPAVTGYFRVRAGKHFPSDVITGYAIGAISGWLIPHLHKRKKLRNENYSIRIGMTPSGFGLNVRF